MKKERKDIYDEKEKNLFFASLAAFLPLQFSWTVQFTLIFNP